MTKYMRFRDKVWAIRTKKTMYWIPDLRRVVFASSLEQCQSKFSFGHPKHPQFHVIERHGRLAYLAYLLFNLYI